ncbi:MAG TPA: hypothetical protein VFA85_02650 [Terriglobales bacterium]|nr:hypothetical protein [Terriglobales bacterium]
MQPRKQMLGKFAQAGICFLYLITSWNFSLRLDESEFSGGRVTGPLLNISDVGSLLFIVVLLLMFFFNRVSAAIMVLAAFLSLPLYIYFIAPGPFRWVFRGEYSVPLRSNFEWHFELVSRAMLLVLAIIVGVHILLSSARARVAG